MNYYNEHDPKAAAWLRELIKQGHIPDGFVDTRSIVDVRGTDLVGYTQCHFFAGIGGWPRALQLAGWPADRPVWTGSCPCQPFSCAGKGKGTADERHLWPEFARLIGECRPATVFGEQVASRAGREWLSGVFADLEGMGYAAAGADLCAAGVGAPHIRQRLFWVGYSQRDGSIAIDKPRGTDDKRRLLQRQGSGINGDLDGPRHTESVGRAGRAHDEARQRRECAPGRAGAGGVGRLCHTSSERLPQRASDGRIQPEALQPLSREGAERASDAGFWDSWEPLYFRDGKTRRTKPGLFCLGHGVSARVVRLRGYGNAIVPQVAAQFIRAAESARLLTDAEVAALTWDFAPDWPEYEAIERRDNAVCDAGRLINKPLD